MRGPSKALDQGFLPRRSLRSAEEGVQVLARELQGFTFLRSRQSSVILGVLRGKCFAADVPMDTESAYHMSVEETRRQREEAI
jgi:hypothetical protein